jgi:ketosteroid isomerase-like protein
LDIEKNKQIVEAFYQAGDRGDMEACLGMLADDIRWTNIGSTRFSGTYVGKRALMEQLLAPLFGSLKAGISSVIENMIAEQDYVVALTSGSAETTDGEPYNNSYCQVMRIRDGKIAEVTEYFDTELTGSVIGRD